MFLSENLSDQLSVYVSEAVVAASVVECQPLVIQTKQVKNRRLQVVNVHRAIGDVKAKFISGAEGDTALHTAAGHPKTERLRMMIATLRSI